MASTLASAHLREDRLRDHLLYSESERDFANQLMDPQVSRAAAALEKALRDLLTCQKGCRMYGFPKGTSGVMNFLQVIMKSSKKVEPWTS